MSLAHALCLGCVLDGVGAVRVKRKQTEKRHILLCSSRCAESTRVLHGNFHLGGVADLDDSNTVNY
jgi:hypothetical protein